MGNKNFTISCSKKLLPSSAAIDLATAYAATEYIEKTKPREPWAKESFQTLIDSLINHSQFVYPHATPKGLKMDSVENLPNILATLKNKKLILPFKKVVAENVIINEKSFKKIFNEFSLFAKSNHLLLKKWVNFHYTPEIKSKHEALMEHKSFTQESMIIHWKKYKKAKILSEEVGIKSNKLMMAFDVFYRGFQYYDILNDANSIYFPHPLRKYIFHNEFGQDENYTNRWSWGNLLSSLVEANKLPRRIDELVDITSKIKNQVQSLNASWYSLGDNEMNSYKLHREKIETIASELGLPAKIKDSTLQIINILFGGFGAAVDTLLGSICLTTITLSVGFYKITENGVYVSGKLGNLKLLRGSLSWPNLFTNMS